MTPSRRRRVIRYAIALDLIVIATGVALLLPPSSAALITCLVIAVILGAWMLGRQGGVTTTIGALIVLGFVFDVRPQDFVFFTVAAIAATTIMPRLRAAMTHKVIPEPPRARRIPPQWLWTLALPYLVALVYSDISDVLILRIGFSPLQLSIVGFAVLIWFYRDALQPWRVLLQPLTLAIGVYTAVIFVSTVWADDLDLADDRVVRAIKSLLIYLVIACLASTWQALRRGIVTMIVVATGLATISIVQIITGNELNELWGMATIAYGTIYGESSDARAAGPLGDANFYGQILVIVIPLTACVAWTARRRMWQLAWVGAAFVITGGMLVTYSRGAMLGLAIMTGIALWALHVPVTRVALGTAIVLVALMFAPGNIGKRFNTIELLFPKQEAYTPPEASFERRKLLTTTAASMFDHHLLWGVGAGNYTTFFQQYSNVVGSAAEHYYRSGEEQHAHSLYLEIGAEMGILGLTVFLGIAGVVYAQLVRVRRDLTARGDPNAYFALGFMLAMAGYLITSLILHGGFQRYFYLLLAFIAALTRIASEEPGNA